MSWPGQFSEERVHRKVLSLSIVIVNMKNRKLSILVPPTKAVSMKLYRNGDW